MTDADEQIVERMGKMESHIQKLQEEMQNIQALLKRLDLVEARVTSMATSSDGCSLQMRSAEEHQMSQMSKGVQISGKCSIDR